MTELIEYALLLPPGRPGELVAKTVSRILKHTFKAKHVRIQLWNNVRRISARVEKRHLESIRGAVQMAIASKQLDGTIVRDPKTMSKFGNLPATPRRLVLPGREAHAGGERSAAESDGDRGARTGEALQEEPQPAPDDAPTAA